MRFAASLVEPRPSGASDLARSVRASASALEPLARRGLRAMLWADLSSEYDARFLKDHLETEGVALGEGFRRALAVWAEDEQEHCAGFREVYHAAFGTPLPQLDAELARRASEVDFAPIAHLMEDEFSIACLFAYDELATVRAYRANRERYELLGKELVQFVAEVTADEGRHFAAFLRLLRDEHTSRLVDAPAVIDRIRASEGVAYANTFVLDHDEDDPVWTAEIFDDAARVLRTHLASFARRAAATRRV